MKVITHGNQYHEPKLSVKECERCRCIFEYSENDVEYYEERISFDDYLTHLFVTCPECRAKIELGGSNDVEAGHGYGNS